MQVSNTVVTENNEVSFEVLIGESQDVANVARFTELNFVGGGNGGAVEW